MAGTNTNESAPIMQAIASVAGLDPESKKKEASLSHVGDSMVHSADELHQLILTLWIDLPTTSSLTMELFVLPSPDAIRRFATARNFRIVASGMRGPTFNAFLAARTARKSGGTCLFLAQLVFDAPQRTLAATFKCEKRKYLQTFLAALALHQLDSFV